MLKTKTLILMLLLTSCNNIVLETVPSTKTVESAKPIDNKVLELKPSTSNISSSSLPVGKNDVSTSDKKETILVASPKPVPSSNSSPNLGNEDCILQASFGTKPVVIPIITATPLPTPTPTPPTTTIKSTISPTPVPSSSSMGGSILEAPPKATPEQIANAPTVTGEYPVPPPQPYSYTYNIPSGILTGTISLRFKDEYMIRYDKEKKQFYSKACKSSEKTEELNKIIYKYNVIVSNYRNTSEEEARVLELEMEQVYNSDIHNELSSYTLSIQEVNATLLIGELRKLLVVRDANYDRPTVPD
jgi:hypothetical protein